MNLVEVLPPAALPARVANGGADCDAPGCYHVATMLVPPEPDTLAVAALWAHGAHTYLVDLARLATTRDEPTARALVGREDVVGVKLVETETAKNVGGQCFGSGFVRWLR